MLLLLNLLQARLLQHLLRFHPLHFILRFLLAPVALILLGSTFGLQRIPDGLLVARSLLESTQSSSFSLLLTSNPFLLTFVGCLSLLYQQNTIHMKCKLEIIMTLRTFTSNKLIYFYIIYGV